MQSLLNSIEFILLVMFSIGFVFFFVVFYGYCLPIRYPATAVSVNIFWKNESSVISLKPTIISDSRPIDTNSAQNEMNHIYILLSVKCTTIRTICSCWMSRSHISNLRMHFENNNQKIDRIINWNEWTIVLKYYMLYVECWVLSC